MRERLGEDFDTFLACYGQPAYRGIRFSRLKASAIHPEGVGQKIPWAKEGYELDGSSKAGLSLGHEAGMFYLQEPSAMLPASVLDVRSGENVIDLCAAPGGKTTQLADAMQGKGILIANEVVPRRAQILSRNVERMGITNCIVTSSSVEALSEKYPEAFDAVMVDAPCSGEGMFRRHPEACDEWTQTGVAGCAQRQKEILGYAAGLVRGGGRIVYATCTMNRQENEDNVDAFLESHPDFELDPFDVPGIDGSRGYYLCLPCYIHGEGQFVARFRRKGSACKPLPVSQAEKTDKNVPRLIEQTVGYCPDHIHALGSTWFSLEAVPDLRGIKVLRAGLHLGEVRKGSFVPDHAWAVSATPPPLQHVSLSEQEAYRYLLGEALPVSEGVSGYVLAAFQDMVLGFGKVTQGLMKNHYPKGLRRDLRRETLPENS